MAFVMTLAMAKDSHVMRLHVTAVTVVTVLVIV
jgi:hypothetical protein